MASGLQIIVRNITKSPVLSLTLLLLLFVSSGMCNKLEVPKQVTGVLGKNLTLTCRMNMTEDITLTQSSWMHLNPSGLVTIAVFNPTHGVHLTEGYQDRLHFVKLSVQDASIVLMDLSFADIGRYTCKMSTFPLGNLEGTAIVDVMAEPKVYISPGERELVDMQSGSLVATCTAERARPAAEVFWESDLYGHSKVVTAKDDLDGTTSTHVKYILTPTRQAHGLSITCVVRHPALAMELRIPYKLSVQFAPDIMVVGQDEVWYVEQRNAKLDCRANANPSPNVFLWTRLDMQMPTGVRTENGSLIFTRPLQKSDTGTYRCEVWNDVGLRSQDVHIWVRERPTTVSTSTTSSTTTTTAPSATIFRVPPTQLGAHVTGPTRPTAEAPSAGVIAAGTLGSILVVVLLLGGILLCYNWRTFRGNYYTKHYKGPPDMQTTSHLDVLQTQELYNFFNDESGKVSPDLKPKPEVDVIYGSGDDKNVWDERLPAMCTYHLQQVNINPSGPPIHGPVQNNGFPYLQENCYDNGTESDYVSHKDGSVISRKECFV